MPTPQWRKQRIDELRTRILNMKKQGKKEIKISELYAPMGLEHGLSFKTFMSYLKLLEDAGLIEIQMDAVGQPEKVVVKENGLYAQIESGEG